MKSIGIFVTHIWLSHIFNPKIFPYLFKYKKLTAIKNLNTKHQPIYPHTYTNTYIQKNKKSHQPNPTTPTTLPTASPPTPTPTLPNPNPKLPLTFSNLHIHLIQFL